ncbi:MAG: cation:proton antiporter [Acidobacteriota bacterium]
METAAFALLALGILGFGLISRRVQTTIVTAPIVFVAFGLALAQLDVLHLEIEREALKLLAEVTLALVLFTDAARMDLRTLRRHHDLPLRLLAIGLPLTVGLGWLLALWIFPELTAWQAAMLAAILAPTDAALGQAVVSSPRVPVRVRQALNVESGLNDGIALPLVLLFMSACAAAVAGESGAAYWGRFAALQVTLGPLVGIAVGWLGGRAVAAARAHGWMDDAFVRLSSLGLALLAFAAAELVHGNGFIAAFVAGLALGHTSREVVEELCEFSEAEGQLLTLLLFAAFGAALLPAALPRVGWPALLYGVLALTVVRMLPVALALLGTGVRPATTLFLGWFGPRGLASVLFALLIVENAAVGGAERVFDIVMVTVALSVLAHGTTAVPGANWYARHTGRMQDDAPEHVPVPELPTRVDADSGQPAVGGQAP